MAVTPSATECESAPDLPSSIHYTRAAPSENDVCLPSVKSEADFPSLPRRAPARMCEPLGWTFKSALLYGKEGFHRFPTLPLEIRRLVYKFAIRNDLTGRSERLAHEHRINDGVDDYTIEVGTYDRLAKSRKYRYSQRSRDEVAKFPLFLPNICRVDGQLFQEAMPVLAGECKFVIREHKANDLLKKLLERVKDDKAFVAVNELTFPNFGYFQGLGVFPSNKDMDLVARCTGLRRLNCNISMDAVFRNEMPGTAFTVQHIVDYYQLHKIFACGSLKQIVIECRAYALWVAVREERVLDDLATWLKAEFESRGEQVPAVSIREVEAREEPEL